MIIDHKGVGKQSQNGHAGLWMEITIIKIIVGTCYETCFNEVNHNMNVI